MSVSMVAFVPFTRGLTRCGTSKAFSVFDASAIPEELELHGSHGQSTLQVLTDHYDPHNVVHPEAAKSELKIFNSELLQQIET